MDKDWENFSQEMVVSYFLDHLENEVVE